jgi:hypothetical protein
MQAYRGAVGAHTSDLAIAAAQAANLLASAIAKQAAVLAYSNGFIAAAAGTFVCLLLTAILPANSAGGTVPSTDVDIPTCGHASLFQYPDLFCSTLMRF